MNSVQGHGEIFHQGAEIGKGEEKPTKRIRNINTS